MKVDANRSKYFVFEEVSEIQVRNALLRLNNSKARDIYGLSVADIKLIKDILIPPLTELLNICIQSHIFPSCLKFAKVVPIFKKDEVLARITIDPYLFYQ